MPLTNPPFTRQKGQMPMYFRDLEPEEMAQWRRMRDNYETLTKQPTGGRQNADSTNPGTAGLLRE